MASSNHLSDSVEASKAEDDFMDIPIYLQVDPSMETMTVDDPLSLNTKTSPKPEEEVGVPQQPIEPLQPLRVWALLNTPFIYIQELPAKTLLKAPQGVTSSAGTQSEYEANVRAHAEHCMK